METQTCRKCGETKELKHENFRFTCNRFKWICRVCQNAHKRKKYHLVTAGKSKPPDPKRLIREAKVQAMVEKYDEVFKTLKSAGVSINAPADFVDDVLDRVEGKLNSRSA